MAQLNIPLDYLYKQELAFDNDSDIVINSSTGQMIGDGDMDAHTAATATIRIFDRGRYNLLIADEIIFTKASQGTAGEDAKVVVVDSKFTNNDKRDFPDNSSGDQDDSIFLPKQYYSHSGIVQIQLKWTMVCKWW